MLERVDSGDATPMDLDIMASVQEQIIGNCLCVLGDAMAMPIGSMVAKFRDELEAEIEAARERADGADLEGVVPTTDFVRGAHVADELAGPVPVH
jgi:NADH-quinone oxidoreductase subunit F